MGDMLAHNEETLKTIFDLMFNKLKSISINDNFMNEITERRTRVFNKDRSDAYFFENLVRDIFNAGMKTAIVTKKLPNIREAFSDFNIEKVSAYTNEDFEKLVTDPKIIRHPRKIKDCMLNAQLLKELLIEHGSFGEFLDIFNENFEDLKDALLNFGSVGPAVALDF